MSQVKVGICVGSTNVSARLPVVEMCARILQGCRMEQSHSHTTRHFGRPSDTLMTTTKQSRSSKLTNTFKTIPLLSAIPHLIDKISTVIAARRQNKHQPDRRLAAQVSGERRSESDALQPETDSTRRSAPPLLARSARTFLLFTVPSSQLVQFRVASVLDTRILSNLLFIRMN